MPFWSRKDPVSDMLDQYERRYGGKTTKARINVLADGPARDPTCCCVKAKYIVALCCFVQFVLGIAVLGVAGFVHNELDFADSPAWGALVVTCIVLGTCVVLMAMVGLVGARSKSRLAIAAYYLCTATLAGITFGIAIYLWAESDRVGAYLEAHWEQIQSMFATDMSREEVEEWVREQLVGAGIVLGLLLTSLLGGVGGAVRMTGTGYAFVATCAMVACIGVISIGIGYVARDRVLPIVPILFYASGAALVLASTAGAYGAAKLSRECLSTNYAILFAGIIIYFYLAGTTYESLVDNPKHVDELVLTMAMGLVSGFWTLLAFVLGLVYFVESRRAIRETEGKQMTALDRI